MLVEEKVAEVREDGVQYMSETFDGKVVGVNHIEGDERGEGAEEPTEEVIVGFEVPHAVVEAKVDNCKFTKTSTDADTGGIAFVGLRGEIESLEI